MMHAPAQAGVVGVLPLDQAGGRAFRPPHVLSMRSALPLVAVRWWGDIRRMDALAALSLQIAWGVDEALDNAPLDRMLHAPARAAAASQQIPRAPVPPLRASPASLAAECANAAATTEELREALAAFTLCPLAATATNLVFADGTPASGVVIVDDTPGPEEDISGKPLAGRAGQLLDRMLATIGLDRSRVLITNLIPWRPPGGRPATDAEIAMCLPFLHRHLALLRPRIVVTLGTAPSQALSGSGAPIRRLRGKWQSVTLPGLPKPVALLPMMHPASLLQTPAAKKEAWADLLALRQALERA